MFNTTKLFRTTAAAMAAYGTMAIAAPRFANAQCGEEGTPPFNLVTQHFGMSNVEKATEAGFAGEDACEHRMFTRIINGQFGLVTAECVNTCDGTTPVRATMYRNAQGAPAQGPVIYRDDAGNDITTSSVSAGAPPCGPSPASLPSCTP
ncbi:MAG: hypothetical protein SFW62_03660 [Alphaproteobacteria bacterium]|nr:hypothetical protein [Alphaproteobacteria bacterium]